MVFVNEPVVNSPELTGRTAEVVRKAVDHLFARQRPDGAWTDRLSSSTVSTALGLLALATADEQRYRDRIELGMDWLRAHQREDGGWSMADKFAPSSPGMTAFAIAACHRLDREGSAERIARGHKFIEANGSFDVIPGMRGPGPKTWPAAAPVAWSLVGLRDIKDQPTLPIEIMLLPPKLRNKVSIGMPAVLALGLMQAKVIPASAPRRFLRWLARPRALAWLRSVMGPNGGVEECPMISALMYLGLHTAELGPDIQQASLEYLLDTQRPDGSWAIDRDLEIAVTCYAVHALAEHIDVATDSRLRRTRDWLLSTQWTEPFKPLNIPAGAWSWNVPSGWPESEDTAVALSTLGLLGLSRDHPKVADGLRWLRVRQNRNGSWSEWVRNSFILNDRPCTGVTAHVVMALHQHGEPRGARAAIDRALRWYHGDQLPDGSLPSLWFRDGTHGTAKVLETYAELGTPNHPVAVRARKWLWDNQAPSGAWPVSVQTSAPGETVEETAWAVYSLLRAGTSPWDPRLVRAVDWLAARQNEAGSWPEAPVGLYFEDLCYSDDLIAHTYTLRALACWLRLAGQSQRP